MGFPMVRYKCGDSFSSSTFCLSCTIPDTRVLLLFSEYDLLQIQPKFSSHLPLCKTCSSYYTKAKFIMLAIWKVKDKHFIISSDYNCEMALSTILIT